MDTKPKDEEAASEVEETKPTEKPTLDDFTSEEIFADDLETSDLPDVSENVIQAQLEKEERESSVDIDGEEFNSDIHATDKNGNPIKNKNGTWRKKRGSKATKSTSKSAKEKEKEQKENESYKASGIMCATVQELGMVAIFGEAGKFDSVSMSKHTAEVWEAYLRHKEVAELPPSVMVAACVISHGVRSAQKPEAEPRVEKIKTKLGLTWHKMKTRWKNRKPKEKEPSQLEPKPE